MYSITFLAYHINAMCGPCVLDFWHNAGIGIRPNNQRNKKESERKQKKVKMKCDPVDEGLEIPRSEGTPQGGELCRIFTAAIALYRVKGRSVIEVVRLSYNLPVHVPRW